MTNEIQQIIIEQIGKLPHEIVVFLSSSEWGTAADEIVSLYNLPKEESSSFKREVSLVLAGLTHPDDFRNILGNEVITNRAVLEPIVASVEEKIFSPIRPALIKFFDGESSQAAVEEVPPVSELQSAVSGQLSVVPPVSRMPDIAPDNLPTNEEPESFLPPLLPKPPNLETRRPSEEVALPAHPFEEKMKKVFTAGQQSLGDLAIEPSTQPLSATQAPKSPPIYHADPYREPIE